MRGVKGLDRPGWQWALVAACVVLITLLASAAMSIRRAGGRIQDAQRESLNARAERDGLEAQLSRERATREALSLELARQRGRGSDNPVTVPTLTLEPSTTRQASPPEGGVTALLPEQVVLLRFVLRSKLLRPGSGYEVTARDWSSGQVRWMRGGLQGVQIEESFGLAVNVTGEMLPAGSYEFLVTLLGSEVATYELTVKSRS
jgi:hypothetical protein